MISNKFKYLRFGLQNPQLLSCTVWAFYAFLKVSRSAFSKGKRFECSADVKAIPMSDTSMRILQYTYGVFLFFFKQSFWAEKNMFFSTKRSHLVKFGRAWRIHKSVIFELSIFPSDLICKVHPPVGNKPAYCFLLHALPKSNLHWGPKLAELAILHSHGSWHLAHWVRCPKTGQRKHSCRISAAISCSLRLSLDSSKVEDFQATSNSLGSLADFLRKHGNHLKNCGNPSFLHFGSFYQIFPS